MMSDLDATVEAEEDRFLRDGFLAMQADLKNGRARVASARRRRDRKRKRHQALSWWRRAYVGGPSGVASLAVIGTLRPTDRRRAYYPKADSSQNRALYCLIPTYEQRRSVTAAPSMELTGIEPVTSAVRLQRSPS